MHARRGGGVQLHAQPASTVDTGSTHVKRCVILTRVEATSNSAMEPLGASTTPTLMASHTCRRGGGGTWGGGSSTTPTLVASHACKVEGGEGGSRTPGSGGGGGSMAVSHTSKVEGGERGHLGSGALPPHTHMHTHLLPSPCQQAEGAAGQLPGEHGHVAPGQVEGA